MRLSEVQSKADWKAFLKVEELLYASDPNHIQTEKVTLKKLLLKNKKWEVKCWVLFNASKELIGRIAAFYFKQDKSRAGLGFFECINDKEAAKLLFDKGISWLESNGCQSARFPTNPGDRDQYWGLMIGEKHEPTFGEYHHHNYYEALVEDYGFEVEFDQYTPRIEITADLMERWEPTVDRLRSRNTFKLKHFNRRKAGPMIADLVEVYNDAWAGNELATALDEKTVRKAFMSMASLIDDNLIWFAYRDKRPVGFFVALPNINGAIKRSGGHLKTWWDYLKFGWFAYWSKPNTAKGVIFGIKPEAQGSGVLLLLAYEFYESAYLGGYKNVELSWIGSFNAKMLSFVEKLGAKPYKQHRTYHMNIINRNG